MRDEDRSNALNIFVVMIGEVMTASGVQGRKIEDINIQINIKGLSVAGLQRAREIR